MRRKKKTIECIEYLSVSAPLDKVDCLEDKQSKYIHEYVKNKEYMIVGTERRHGFSQNDVDRQWHQIVDKIRKKQVDGVIVANMSVITDNLIDAFIKVAQVQAAGGIIVTVDDGRLPRFSCHIFRHTFASRFCENETNVKVIQEVMGHADVSTTMNIYAEANPEVTREALEKLAKNMDVF